MQQLSLFQEIAEPTPWTYIPEFLTRQEASELLAHCKQLNWHQSKTSMWGKSIPNPRLECLYGNPRISYKYGSVKLDAQTWTAELYAAAARIVGATGYKFNYCIGNLYRDGNDSIGWHADNDLSMGSNPAIASLSLGQMRLFQIKSVQEDSKIDQIWLEHGSLLIMQPGMQSTHVHRVPKVTRGWCGERINLTFRPWENA